MSSFSGQTSTSSLQSEEVYCFAIYGKSKLVRSKKYREAIFASLENILFHFLWESIFTYKLVSSFQIILFMC